ncbi:glycosyltransferase family 2 protein [Candidatus Falkowbacteria bacterium]|jgi:O-antigen biosynthesis protein|nr:glycosyltransferase family 2 protein [Candidatus Falkowbacteria bacterium]MBT6573509.1 glycosyltransferase family 2 protein [Candidatus Falkowbacteria bacterium]MBT7348059.1 glycosyltransferase family 2 protein [Candidatus Falkowbacteria bacterium]MBT7501106.1 glycosyltransferase family 2 protein [Candidatus Falkowbacteria bacterium]
MHLSIITVSWNVRDLLSRLLDSIFQFTDDIEYEVIVVDNDSKDGTVESLHKYYKPWIKSGKLKIIDNKHNAGFGKANNQGLKMSQGKYVLFMNPDMELLENSFQKLHSFMKKTPNVGICTCRLLYGDKTTQPNIKINPDLCSQILILLKLHHFLGFLPCLKKYLQKDFDYTQKSYVKQIMGAFVFTRQEIMAKMEGWDEDYWIWWEDLQLCKDVQELGHDLVYLPITEVVHYEGKSFAQTFGLKKQKRFNKGMLTYFRKNHSMWSYVILLLLQPLSYILTFITQMFRIKPRPQSKI